MLPVPLIHDGVYKIRIGRFVADLSEGSPVGHIVGWEDVGTNAWDRWMIKNHGAGGNQVTIENLRVPGAFANVHREGAGAPLVGDRHATLWTVVKLDQGTYYIQTRDGQYVWELPKSVDGAPVVLRHHSGQPNQKWMFVKE